MNDVSTPKGASAQPFLSDVKTLREQARKQIDDEGKIDRARSIFGRPRASQRNTTLEFDEQIGIHAYLDLLAFDMDRCIRIR